MPPVFRILPTVQQYDWGKIGSASQVAELAVASKIPGFELDETAPYAELWMGTHPKSPSRVFETQEILSEYLAAHPELIGDRAIQRFDASNGNLPFLFKVLSIEKALSIQTHPDKATATKLHAEQPSIYKDPNHKPEMALALTPFAGLCGFLPLSQISANLLSTPELSALIPSTIADRFHSIASSSTPTAPAEKAALKDIFSALMTANESLIATELDKLVQRYTAQGALEDDRSVARLVLRLNEQFPGDIGIFCAFMLNFVHLQPGEAIFLGAGEPHAYISGDIMECMANSDNVIRAGLTPKLRDIPNLVSGLTYTAAPPTNHIIEPTNFSRSSSAATMLYKPPVPEFSVLRVQVNPGCTEKHAPLDGPSILILTSGHGSIVWNGGEGSLSVSKGYVLFVGAGVDLEVKEEDLENLVFYRAFAHEL
ncbi:hypothetical protein PLICRDRAFT_130294 [Plicaturopsis crispa FD-325 SS-3]|nr:hypothetical protein PLICRDRAFT_130294 [Plicaturopsis crispa FD-325 SS-3]